MKHCLVSIHDSAYQLVRQFKQYPYKKLNTDIIIINDIRPTSLTDQLRTVCDNTGLLKDAIIIDGNDIISYYIDKYGINRDSIQYQYIMSYTGIVNILLIPYLLDVLKYDKMIFINGDKRILRDPVKNLLLKYDNAAMHDGGNNTSFTGNGLVQFNELRENIIGFESSLAIFERLKINIGIFVLSKTNYDITEFVKKYMMSTVFSIIFFDNTSKYSTFFIDAWFISAVFVKMIENNCNFKFLSSMEYAVNSRN